MCPRNLRYLRLFRDDSGATAVEYSLLAVLIAAVIVGIVLLLGQQISAAFSTVYNALQGA